MIKIKKIWVFNGCDNEQGSLLLITLLILMLLTLIGMAATRTTSIENLIAGNEKVYKQNCYIAEGGANKEASIVGYAGVNGLAPWFMISNPGKYNQLLLPSIASNYDPSGQDMLPADINVILSNPPSFTDFIEQTTKWPRQNLIDDTADNIYDYAYLVTYLHSDLPLKGMDATHFSSYKFRINGQRQSVIELGAGKIGPKNSL